MDVDYIAERPQWTQNDVFDAQPYMEFGVRTDNQLRVAKDGTTLANVYAVGQILSGNNKLKLCNGEGLDMLTALAVANTIKK